MEKSSLLDEKSLTRIVLGVAIGIALTGFVGFSGLGWKLDSSARDMAKAAANSAVVEALAPICADKFEHAADVSKNKVALMKASSSEQATLIVQGGWAKFPGNSNSSNSSAVAEACAKMVAATK